MKTRIKHFNILELNTFFHSVTVLIIKLQSDSNQEMKSK